MAGDTRLIGMIVRKERWGLSWSGRLTLTIGIVVILGVVFFRIYPFLAQTRPVRADVLVVEGWIHEYGIRCAMQEFAHGQYRSVIATGGPVQGIGHYINDFQTEASVGADLLKKYGIPADLVQAVPSRVMDRDRTYASAVALRNWFDSQNPDAHSINIVTEDVHARRTRLLFQKALGPGFSVGIIAATNPDYDWKHWWRYSQGVKDVVTETAAYVYAKSLFWPGARPKDTSQH